MLKHLPETALDTLLHIFNGIWITGVFSRKLAFGHNYTYSQTTERSCRTNKLQTKSANKLPLQNTIENDKQTTCLVLRIEQSYKPASVAQLDARPTGDQEVAGSTPAEVGSILSWRLIMKYFLRSFSPFR